MLGRSRHFPARNGWNQCRKVRLYDSPKLGKSEKRTQPSYHLSSPTTSMSRRMPSDEFPDVKDAKGPEIDWSASELLGEEPVDMPRVVVDRCTIQPSSFPQVHAVLGCQTFRWAGCD